MIRAVGLASWLRAALTLIRTVLGVPRGCDHLLAAGEGVSLRRRVDGNISGSRSGR